MEAPGSGQQHQLQAHAGCCCIFSGPRCSKQQLQCGNTEESAFECGARLGKTHLPHIANSSAESPDVSTLLTILEPKRLSFNRNWTTFACPFCAAQWRAVRPQLSVNVTSTFSVESKTLTTSTCPF